MTLFTTYFAREGMNLQYPCSAALVKYYNAKERLQANKLAAHKPSLPLPPPSIHDAFYIGPVITLF